MIELYIWYYVMKMAFYLCGPPSSNLHHKSNHEKNIRCIWIGGAIYTIYDQYPSNIRVIKIKKIQETDTTNRNLKKDMKTS